MVLQKTKSNLSTLLTVGVEKYPSTLMTDTHEGDSWRDMPSQYSRFAYGDKVWEVISGNSINLNGTMLQMAQQICGFMKQPINAKMGVTRGPSK